MWVPFGVVFLGILIMYAAWALEHPERHLLFVRVLDPVGYKILSCYDTLRKGGTVTHDADGFAPVAAMIVRELTVNSPGQFFPQQSYPSPAVVLFQEGRLEVLDVSSAGEVYTLSVGEIGVGRAFLKDVQITCSVDQEILEAGPFNIASFRDELVDKYVDSPLFRWSLFFFILGLAFSVVSTFSAMRWQNPSPPYYREL